MVLNTEKAYSFSRLFLNERVFFKLIHRPGSRGWQTLPGIADTAYRGAKMQNRRRLITGAFVVLVLVAIATVVMIYKKPSEQLGKSRVAVGAHGGDQSKDISESSLLKTAAPARTKRVAHVQATFEIAATAPDAIVAQSKDAAQKGNPAAQRVLADALYKCATEPMGSDDEVEAAIVKRSLVYEAAMKKAGVPVQKDAAYLGAIQGQVEVAKATRDSCKNVPTEESKDWLSWMEKAAIAGDQEARADYAWRALDEYKTNEDRLANDDEYARRRDKAFGLLQDSIENGNCNDAILNGFRKVSPDAATSYVYQSLLLRRGLAILSTSPPSPDVEMQRESINQELKRLAAAVPDDQLATADQSISYIQQNNCQE